MINGFAPRRLLEGMEQVCEILQGHQLICLLVYSCERDLLYQLVVAACSDAWHCNVPVKNQILFWLFWGDLDLCCITITSEC